MGSTRHRSSGMALVQSNAGGFGTTTTSAVGYNNKTTAGNLLVCVVWASASSSRGAGIQTPVTSGFTWTLATSATFSDVGTAHGAVSIYYIANASSMATSVTTTVTSSVSLDDIEFSLYEFSGLTAGVSVDTTEATSSTSGGTPNTTSLTTSATDLIIVAMSAVGSNGSAGSRYTLGINAANQFSGCVGQTQYILNQAQGTIATSFGTSQTYWGCCAVAFKA